MRQAIISVATGLMFMVVSSGCAAWTTEKPKNKNSMWTSMQFWKKPYQKPNQLAAIWTHDVLTMTGKPPTRGFGGRLYFYNDKSKAISVDGELIVHGYEEARIGYDIQIEKTKADKTFMFTAEQFTEHFSPSDLGASYSIWIPWDGVDGMQKEITLIPTFKDKNGVIVQGEPAKLVLPGAKPKNSFAAVNRQQVSYQQSEMPTNMGPLPNQSTMRTTTISMPSNHSRIAKGSSTPNNLPAIQRGNVTDTASDRLAYVSSPQAIAEQSSAAQANRSLLLQAAMANEAPIRSNQETVNTQAQNVAWTLPPNHPLYQPAHPMSQPNTSMPNMVPNQANHFGTQPQNSFQQNPPASMPVYQPNVLNPGIPASYIPVQPGAVQAAFNSTGQWQPLGQPLGQPNLNSMNPVQQAVVNGATPATTVAPALAQPPAISGQFGYQR